MISSDYHQVFWDGYVKNDGVTDGVTDFESSEYSSHILANPVDQINGSEWVLVTVSKNGKKRWTTYYDYCGRKVM